MFRTVAIITMMLISSSALAGQTLKCQVKDWDGGINRKVEPDFKELTVTEGRLGIIARELLKDGQYSCEVFSDLRRGKKSLSIHLLRADGVTNGSVDSAFSADKKVNLSAEIRDLSQANRKGPEAGDEEGTGIFAAGTCFCKTAE